MITLYRCIICIIFTTLAFCQTLDINTLEKLVIEQNPQLLVSAKQIQVQEGSLAQSRKLPNPVLEMESGSGADPETSGMISQTILLGGKRKHKIRLSELDLLKAHLEYEKLKQEKLTVAFQSFTNILHLQEVKSIQTDKISVAEVLLKSVSKKVEAGKLSPAEKSRAKIQHFQEQMKLREIDKSLEIAWISISSLWGDGKPRFNLAVGHFLNTPTMSSSNSLDKSPAIQLAELSVVIRRINIKSEKAEVMPDLDLDAGIKRSDIPGNTYQIGFSLPIPIFNRNQGKIKSAGFELERAELELKATKTELTSLVKNIQTELALLYSETETLKDEIIPEAQTAYTIISDGYLNGRFTYLDVVDAQKMWFQSREQYMNALKDYHANLFELDRITGNSNHTNFKEKN